MRSVSSSSDPDWDSENVNLGNFVAADSQKQQLAVAIQAAIGRGQMRSMCW